MLDQSRIEAATVCEPAQSQSQQDNPMPLKDPHGRVMRKLRVSLWDACNFRCVYCMPNHPSFIPKKELLGATELASICGNLVHLGIDEIRLTGGEPTLRSDLCEIALKLSELSLQKLAMTTNAWRLSEYLVPLRSSKLNSLNISLDSLQEANFFRITKRKGFTKVRGAIEQAQSLGFEVKINMVVMKGLNDHELEDFIKFSADHKVPVRFLELMTIGVANQMRSAFMSAKEIMNQIGKNHTLERENDRIDSTARNFRLENGAQIGFIASETMSFCGSCSRLRLTAKGELRPCLFQNFGMSLVGKTLDDTAEIVQQILKKKPYERISHINQPMFQIGG